MSDEIKYLDGVPYTENEDEIKQPLPAQLTAYYANPMFDPAFRIRESEIIAILRDADLDLLSTLKPREKEEFEGLADTTSKKAISLLITEEFTIGIHYSQEEIKEQFLNKRKTLLEPPFFGKRLMDEIRNRNQREERERISGLSPEEKAREMLKEAEVNPGSIALTRYDALPDDIKTEILGEDLNNTNLPFIFSGSRWIEAYINYCDDRGLDEEEEREITDEIFIEIVQEMIRLYKIDKGLAGDRSRIQRNQAEWYNYTRSSHIESLLTPAQEEELWASWVKAHRDAHKIPESVARVNDYKDSLSENSSLSDLELAEAEAGAEVRMEMLREDMLKDFTDIEFKLQVSIPDDKLFDALKHVAESSALEKWEQQIAMEGYIKKHGIPNKGK